MIKLNFVTCVKVSFHLFCIPLLISRIFDFFFLWYIQGIYMYFLKFILFSFDFLNFFFGGGEWGGGGLPMN